MRQGADARKADALALEVLDACNIATRDDVERRMSSVVARMIRCGARASVVIRTIVGLPPPILMSLCPVWMNSFGTTTPALCRISSAARGEMNCDTFSPLRS